MAEKSSKSPPAAEAEKPFVLDSEALERDAVRAQLSPIWQRHFNELFEEYDELAEIANLATLKEREGALKEFKKNTQLAKEEERLAGIAVTDPAQARAEYLRWQALALQAGRQADEKEAGPPQSVPELYYAAKTRREVRMEEYKKLATDNWTELVMFFERAVKHKDRPKAEAIMTKLTTDGNENELLNWYGYPSTAVGLRRFFEEIMRNQLGMQEQEALSFASDISYTAEKSGHWEVARVVKKLRSGKFIWMEEQEHALECMVEIGKMPDPRSILRKLNRLGHGGEEIVGTIEEYRKGVERGDASRNFTPAALGLLVLANYPELFAQQRWHEVNANLKLQYRNFLLALNVSEDQRPEEMEKRRQFMQSAGIDSEIIKMFIGKVQPGKDLSLGTAVEKVFAAKRIHKL